MDEKTKSISIYVIAIAMFMEMLDATVLNTSLPQIAKSLHTNPIELKIIITTYLLTLGIFIPVSGWLVDRVGERIALITAIIIFCLSSIGCGLSNHLWTLTLFRLLQGVGGAFLAPVARLILVRIYGRKNTVKAMARISTITITGMGLGPIVGGAMTTYMGWRWIFFINIPFSIIGIFLVYRYLPALSERIKRPFDFLGFALIGGALGLSLFFLDILTQPIFTLSEKLDILLLVAFLTVAYVWHAKRGKNLLLNFNVFKNKTFKLAAFGSLTSRFTLSTTPFLIPLMLQSSYGYTALQSGLLVIPSMVGALGSRPVVNNWLQRFGYRKLLLVNTLIIFFTYLTYTINAYDFSPVILIVQQFIVGFCMALQFTGMNSLAYKNLDTSQISQGTSIYSAIVQLSASFGIAFAALTMITAIGFHHLTHDVPLIAFKVVFLVQALFMLVTFWLFYQLDCSSLPLHHSSAKAAQ